jgi:hypothetical protein
MTSMILLRPDTTLPREAPQDFVDAPSSNLLARRAVNDAGVLTALARREGTCPPTG